MQYLIDKEQLAKELEFDLEDIDILLETFQETVMESLEELQDGIKKKNFQQIFESAHSIKGSSANLRFIDISELAKDIELNARANNNINYYEKYEELYKLLSNIDIS